MNEYLHHDFSEGWDDLKYYTTKEVAEILGIDRIDLLKTMLEGFHITYFDKDNLFANYVLKSNKWKKWTKSNSNKDLKFKLSAHYHYKTKYYENIIKKINKNFNYNYFVIKKLKNNINQKFK